MSITNWADRLPHPPEVEFIFEGGRAVEELALKDFEDAGFKVYRPEPDKGIMESRPRITGHIDIRVDFGDGQVVTGEIKGLNVYDWQKLNTIEDFFSSKKPWILKYPAQLMTYLYIKGEERGFFYLKSIPRFQPKLIWVPLDYGYMETILQKTERVEKHIQTGTMPDPIGDPVYCPNCAFLHICLPEIRQKAMEFVFDDDELLEKLERRYSLTESHTEYEHLDKDIKAAFRGRERLMIGDFLIIGNKIEPKGKQPYLKYKITKLTPGKTA
jgi:CRISPR/Cas system-associated exonuclease Cas4 (RecB family)